MIVQINNKAVQFNCCWYCTRAGDKFEVEYSIISRLYELKIKGEVHYININHADKTNK